MPIYEYLCDACAHRFEVRQKFSDPAIETCVRCGKSVRKVISPPGIMFKGSGWYVTDYSNKLKGPSDAASNGTGDGKVATKETAPAEKPAASSEKAAPAAPKEASSSTTPTSSGSGSSSSSSS